MKEYVFFFFDITNFRDIAHKKLATHFYSVIAWC